MLNLVLAQINQIGKQIINYLVSRKQRNAKEKCLLKVPNSFLRRKDKKKNNIVVKDAGIIPKQTKKSCLNTENNVTKRLKSPL